VFHDHGESEDEVEYVVDGETREVAVGRGLHRLASEDDNVDDVPDTAERDDCRNERLEGHCLDDVEKQFTFPQSGMIILLMMLV